jgi:hypothetical protein
MRRSVLSFRQQISDLESSASRTDYRSKRPESSAHADDFRLFPRTEQALDNLENDRDLGYPIRKAHVP